MKGFGRWQRMDGLERRLRHDRPVPPDELLDEVVRRLEGSRPARSTRTTVRRLGLAGAAAAMMLAVFAAFGGVGLAASGASNAASSTVDAILTVAKPAKAKPAKPKTKSVPAKLTAAGEARAAHEPVSCRRVRQLRPSRLGERGQRPVLPAAGDDLPQRQGDADAADHCRGVAPPEPPGRLSGSVRLATADDIERSPYCASSG